jgi:hypothetical protein
MNGRAWGPERTTGVRFMRVVPQWLTISEESVAAVFTREGFQQTRMEQLAAACGVPRATLYYHFGGKDEVLAWLLRSTLDDLGALPGAACEPGSGRTPP